MSISKTASSLIIVSIIIVFLIFCKSLLIPFILALLVWFVIKESRNQLRRIPFVRNKFPVWLQSTFTALLIFAFLGGVLKILSLNIQSLSSSLPVYEKNISNITQNINSLLGIDLISNLKSYSTKFDFGGIIQSVFKSLTDIIGDGFMIVLYVVFLMLEEMWFSQKLKYIFNSQEKYSHVQTVVQKINQSVSNYISLKTFVSFLTGILSYIALEIIGIEAAAFWAILIFLLNFVPTVGSLIATLFPAIFALLQFGVFFEPVIVLIVVGLIQILVGNVIEPKIMGNSLNISPLVVLLSLTVWGAIWGITGMILSVPITVIMIIIFAEFDSTRYISILLSDKGKV